MWQIFEKMYALVKSEGIDFIEELNNVFDNYVSYGGPFLAGHEQYKAMFLDIFVETMQSTQLGAQDRVSACKLAGQTMLCLKGSIDQHMERYICTAMSFVVRKNATEEPIVTDELFANALELVVTALYYSPHVTIQVLSQHGQVDAFFSYWFKELSTFTRVHDRKICILAITALLTAMPSELSGMQGVPEQLMQAALTAFDGLPRALKGEFPLPLRLCKSIVLIAYLQRARKLKRHSAMKTMTKRTPTNSKMTIQTSTMRSTFETKIRNMQSTSRPSRRRWPL